MLETRRTIIDICQDYNPQRIAEPWTFPERNITSDSIDMVLGLFIVAAAGLALFAFGFERVLSWVFGRGE